MEIWKTFNEEYYERGEALGLSCYSNYRWLPELTIPMAHEMVSQLGIRRWDTILDHGCAKGFLVRALRFLHYKAWGVDVSAYAISSAPVEVKQFVSAINAPCQVPGSPPPKEFDWTISKDVLEHVPYDELRSVLGYIREMTRHAFVSVPLGDGKTYNAPEYERDVTHIIRENTGWWSRQFEGAGLSVESVQTDMPYVKKSRCKESDGFFVLSRR